MYVKGVPIPYEDIVSFRREHGLTIDGMAVYFGVARATVCGWLYRHNHQKMNPVFYDRVMQKMADKQVSACAVKQHYAGIVLDHIVSAIKGDTDECWLHYVSEIYPSNAGSEKPIISAYIGIGQSTLKRWLNLMMPEGQNLLRLRCFLARRGYGVAEFDALSDVLRTTSYLIADRKITISEVVKKTKYHKDGPLLQVLLGRENMSYGRLALCRELIAEYVIGEEKTPVCNNESLPANISDAAFIPVLISVGHRDEKHATAQYNGTQKWEVENLAALVRMMLPLAERMLSDACTEQDRERLRTLANRDGVFRLSNALSGLCGPRVRSRIMNKQEGE